MTAFRGTLTALITPFRDGGVDFKALDRLVERQLAAGIDGLVPCGTTGEAPTLTPDEQRQVIERVVGLAAGSAPVLAGAGGNCTSHVLELARQAVRAGADGVLVVSPYYNKPTQDGLSQHFATVAAAVEAPVVLYNIPGRTGVEIAVETICRLRERHDNIVAVKHATGRVLDAAELLQTCAIDVLSGDDPLTLPLMSVGAVGVISVLSNLAPRAVRELTDAMLRGDLDAARAAHGRLFPLARTLLSLETNPIPVKTALALRGLCAEEFRLPLCPMSAENRTRLGALLGEAPLD